METKSSTQSKGGLINAYKNTFGTTSSPNLKYNTVNSASSPSTLSKSTEKSNSDEPRTKIRITQTSKNIFSLKGDEAKLEKKKSKDDSFIKESSAGIVKSPPAEKQMSRATISISNKNHMDLITNIRNVRANTPTPTRPGTICFSMILNQSRCFFLCIDFFLHHPLVSNKVHNKCECSGYCRETVNINYLIFIYDRLLSISDAA
jgi:hypothetical protein